MHRLQRFFPFLRWFPMQSGSLRTDILAGVTVALVLIPQSMAYAQLAGLPAYYGLYAAFLPVIVAALWGSSSQLATGPVAMVSLLTASSLAPLAAAGSDQFIVLAILLALMVGILQLALGLFKLGAIVNFLSHPVIVGFTNAAAIIIALSQLNKLLGVPMARTERFMNDIGGVLAQIGDTHWPTLAIGLSAMLIIWLLRRYVPKAPGVLIAVALTTIISWQVGFERNAKHPINRVVTPSARAMLEQFGANEVKLEVVNADLARRNTALNRLVRQFPDGNQQTVALHYQIELAKLQLKDIERANRLLRQGLRKLTFSVVNTKVGPQLYLHDHLPPGIEREGPLWRIKKISKGVMQLSGGGEVVGSIPSGLPVPQMPVIDLEKFMSLISATFVISLIGFMESISIAKAVATRTRERIDANQELVGQGLANIVGSFTQSYPVSGSFSRTAVNANAGARTGMSSVFTALMVLITLLFLTPLLYHLPQAVLAGIIMMAVFGLINFKEMKHAWRAHKHDGIAGITTFVATLAFAPHLDNGIIVGAGLALILLLYRSMQPRVAILGRHTDGTLRDARRYNLPLSEYVVAIRFDGSLYFANVAYFEDAILEATAKFPNARYILIVGDGINELDASGEEIIGQLVDRLRQNQVALVFSGLKNQVKLVLENTGLAAEIGESNFFTTADAALKSIQDCSEAGYCEILLPKKDDLAPRIM